MKTLFVVYVVVNEVAAFKEKEQVYDNCQKCRTDSRDNIDRALQK